MRVAEAQATQWANTRNGGTNGGRKRDTILDLIWDSIGALVAGVVAFAMAKD